MFKTAGLYAVGAFLFTEILLAFIDRSPLSESGKALAACALVSVFIGGFPVVLWLAWLFDLTRHGVSKETPWARGHNLTAVSAMLAVVAATALGLWTMNPCGLGRVLGVAVLPCSYQGVAELEGRGTAISAELNYRLSHLPQLRVPAESSVVFFAKRVLNPVELASELGVDRLVECSARPAGSKLSFNLQLFDPGDSDKLWSREYAGQAADELLSIQAAFRDLVGISALNVAARGGGVLDEVNVSPTVGVEAWRMYQRALEFEAERDPESALSSYRKAVVLDPDFARAHASAARLLWYATFSPNVDEAKRSPFLDAARAHISRALQSNPLCAESLAMKRVLMRSGEDPEPLHAKITGIRPSYAEEHYWWGTWLAQHNRQDEAEAALAEARALDPSGEIMRRYQLVLSPAD